MTELTDGAGLWSALRRRKLVQWALAYAAAAWLALQVLQLLASAFEWPPGALRLGTLAAAVGFPVALVLAWYHGERGAQRVSGTELVILAALLGGGGALLWQSATKPVDEALPAAVPAPPSVATIAVLPFANLSGDAAQEYFSDGISEELLNVLARLPGLQVAARTSTFQFKGRNLDVQDIGRRLNVATVLEGSLRKSGTRVRISAQLIDARTGFEIWSDAFDRELADVLVVQGEIARAIAAQLARHLRLPAQPAPSKLVTRTVDPAAYDAYLRGRELIYQRTRASVAEGRAELQRAVALAPDYAPAWAQLGLAWFLSRRASSGYGDVEPAEGARELRAALEAARRLDPELDEVWAVDGLVRQFLDNDLAGALAAYERAIALNPGSVQAAHARADVLSRLGRYEDSLAQRLSTARIDPLFMVNNALIVCELVLRGRREEARPFLERVSDPRSRLYVAARDCVPDFEGAWERSALLHLDGLAHDPADWARRDRVATRLLMLGLPELVAGGFWDGADSIDYAPAVAGDWAAAVARFGEVPDLAAARSFVYFRRGQHLARAGRAAEALAQFDAVWPNVWNHGLVDDPIYLTPRRLWYAALLREAGRTAEVDRVVAINRAEVAAARRAGNLSPIVDLLEAELAAWQGDEATLLRLLPRGLMVEPFISSIESDPVYTAVRNRPGFIAAVEGERRRRAALRERFLGEACALPSSAAWRPPAAACGDRLGRP